MDSFLFLYAMFLFVLSIFFFTGFWYKINEPIPFIRTKKTKGIYIIIIKIFSALFSSSLSGVITYDFAAKLLNIRNHLKMSFEIRTDIYFSVGLVIACLVAYEFSSKYTFVVRNLVEMITGNEEKASLWHEKANKPFRIFFVIITLYAPIWGILKVIEDI